MTNKQLEKFGLFPYRLHRSNTKYWFEPAREYVNIPKGITKYYEVLEIIYDLGVKDGKVKGELGKLNEIRNVLGIID